MEPIHSGDEQRASPDGEIESNHSWRISLFLWLCVNIPPHSRRFKDLDVTFWEFQYLPSRQVWVQTDEVILSRSRFSPSPFHCLH